MKKKNLKGAFAWGLGEDANDFTHFKKLTSEVKRYAARHQNEKLDTTSVPLLSPHFQDEL